MAQCERSTNRKHASGKLAGSTTAKRHEIHFFGHSPRPFPAPKRANGVAYRNLTTRATTVGNPRSIGNSSPQRSKQLIEKEKLTPSYIIQMYMHFGFADVEHKHLQSSPNHAANETKRYKEATALELADDAFWNVGEKVHFMLCRKVVPLWVGLALGACVSSARFSGASAQRAICAKCCDSTLLFASFWRRQTEHRDFDSGHHQHRPMWTVKLLSASAHRSTILQRAFVVMSRCSRKAGLSDMLHDAVLTKGYPFMFFEILALATSNEFLNSWPA